MVKEVLMIPHQTHTQTTSLSSALRAITMAALCTLPVSACDIVDNWQSGAVDAGTSMPAEKVMSGEYEVGPDGKLLNPNRDNLPDVPQKPAAMNKNNAEGAEAFARQYLNMVHYMWLTNETYYLEVASDPECKWCQDKINRAKQRRAKGGWINGTEFKIEELTAAFEIPDHQDLWHKEIRHVQEKGVFYDGHEVFQHGGGTTTLILQMRFDKEDGWKMNGVRGEKE